MAPNQSPVVTVPASAINATEDTSVVLTGVTLSDVDADVADVRATLTVASGLLTLSTGVPGGVTAANIVGNGTVSIIVTAPLAAINATLAAPNGLIYTPNADQAGLTTVVVSLDDLANIGLGGALTDTKTLTIDIAPVNDAPVLTFSSAAIATTENGPATRLDPAAAIADIDSSDFDGGVVSAQLSSVESSDRLSIRNEVSKLDRLELQVMT